MQRSIRSLSRILKLESTCQNIVIRRHVHVSSCQRILFSASNKITKPLFSNEISQRFYSDNVEDDSNNEEEKQPRVLVEKLENFHIMTIGINRPDKRNAVDTPTAEDLKHAFQDFEDDENMYCAVLHGLGGNFCAGYDLEELSELEDDLSNKIAEIIMDQGPMGPTKMEITKPVIAAVNGYCVAGGLELAIMCDLRVVEDNSKLGFLNRRFGVPLIDGGTVRLPALVGMSRAMDLILTGRILEPKEALDWGLANRVVTSGTAFGQAMNLAKEIVKFPQECLRADRQSALYNAYSAKNLETALSYETEHSARVLTTEAIVGAKKFAAGMGKHGKFNVNQISEKEAWQKELEEMKNSIKKEESK